MVDEPTGSEPGTQRTYSYLLVDYLRGLNARPCSWKLSDCVISSGT